MAIMSIQLCWLLALASFLSGLSGICSLTFSSIRPFTARHANRWLLHTQATLSKQQQQQQRQQQTSRREKVFRLASSRCTDSVATNGYSGEAGSVNEVNDILNALVKTDATQPIILQWSPQRGSIWHRWKGTVWQTTAIPTLCLSGLSLAICLIAKHNRIMGGIGEPMISSGRFFLAMTRLDRLWQMHLTVLSFFLAFYLNTAKSLFDSVLAATRQVQGRLNDMNLIAASHARRDPETGEMTLASKNLCTTIGRYTRLFVILFYSSHCNRYASLLTPAGLAGLQERELVTPQEAKLLKDIPPANRKYAVLTWIMSTFASGCENEPSTDIRMSANAHFAFLLRTCDLRQSCATITDLVDARCPLAYVHLVQLLVDSFLILTPFAALGADMGWFSIGATFLLSAFFCGLMDLAKMLYDPMDNEVFGDIDNIQVDTLIQETNSGSIRFVNTGAELPDGARPPSILIPQQLQSAPQSSY